MCRSDPKLVSQHETRTLPGTKYRVECDSEGSVYVSISEGAVYLFLEELREIVKFAEYHSADVGS